MTKAQGPFGMGDGGQGDGVGGVDAHMFLTRTYNVITAGLTSHDHQRSVHVPHGPPCSIYFCSGGRFNLINVPSRAPLCSEHKIRHTHTHTHAHAHARACTRARTHTVAVLSQELPSN